MNQNFRPANSDVGGQFQRRQTGRISGQEGDAQPAVRYRVPTVKAPPTPRTGLCHGNDNTCKAFQAKGTVYCNGHLNKMAKLQKLEREAAEDVTDELV